MAPSPSQFADADEDTPINEDNKSEVIELKIDQGEDKDVTSSNNKRERATEPTSAISKASKRTKLSKWASRLFDPNRIRGLIETPKTIPLNDEFLSAFGKRKKQQDESTGVVLQVDTNIEDEEDATSDEQIPSQNGKNNLATETTTTTTPASASNKQTHRKLKITNILYTTTKETIQTACEAFGDIVRLDLPMQSENTKLNAGVAYVTFSTTDAATACCEELTSLDHRPIRALLAPTTSATPASASSNHHASARYWKADTMLAIKCYKCGQPGHMAADCPNQPQRKPCGLCASIDGHDVRECPWRQFCFHCGRPGRT